MMTPHHSSHPTACIFSDAAIAVAVAVTLQSVHQHIIKEGIPESKARGEKKQKIAWSRPWCGISANGEYRAED
jgi:hypothetical protein